MKKIWILIIACLLISCQNNISTQEPIQEEQLVEETENTVEEVSDNTTDVVEASTYSAEIIEITAEYSKVYDSIDKTKVIGKVIQYDTFLLNEIVNKDETTWYAFDYYGQTGYLLADYAKVYSKEISMSTLENNHASVSVDILNVRNSYAETSPIINKAYKNEQYPILDKKQDESNRVWYYVELEFGSYGWIAGWYCDENDSSYRYSNLLDELQPDTQNYISKLLLEDYKKLEDFIKVYPDYEFRGKVKDKFYLYRIFEYENGLRIFNNFDSYVHTSFNHKSFSLFNNPRVSIDCHETSGIEKLILLDEEIIIFDEENNILSSHVLRDRYDSMKLIDIDNDGLDELMLSNGNKDQIYTIKNGFEVLPSIDLINNSKKHIELSLNDQTLIVKDLQNNQVYESKLPERLLYMSNAANNPSDIIMGESNLSYNEQSGQLEIITDIKIAVSEPNYNIAESNQEFNYSRKLSLGSIIHTYNDSKKIINTNVDFKYNDKDLEYQQFIFNELIITDNNDVSLTPSSSKDAFMSLIEPNASTHEYPEFCVYSNDDLLYVNNDDHDYYLSIQLLSDKFETIRGLKVGMSKEEVLNLFGTPDETVENQMTYYVKADFYDIITCGNFWHEALIIYFEDGKVIKISIESLSHGG